MFSQSRIKSTFYRFFNNGNNKMIRFYQIIVAGCMFLALAFTSSHSDAIYAGQNIIRSNSFEFGQKKQIKAWGDFDDNKYTAPDRKRSHKRRRKVKPPKESR